MSRGGPKPKHPWPLGTFHVDLRHALYNGRDTVESIWGNLQIERRDGLLLVRGEMLGRVIDEEWPIIGRPHKYGTFARVRCRCGRTTYALRFRALKPPGCRRCVGDSQIGRATRNIRAEVALLRRTPAALAAALADPRRRRSAIWALALGPIQSHDRETRWPTWLLDIRARLFPVRIC